MESTRPTFSSATGRAPLHASVRNINTMNEHRIGIIMNGVTGRMGTNQHLVRSVLAIREQGGVVCGNKRIIPDVVLTGRNKTKLQNLAERHGVENYTTDLDAVLVDEAYPLFFDASGTPFRVGFLERAIEAGKHIYCEKPTANAYGEALAIAEKAEKAGGEEWKRSG